MLKIDEKKKIYTRDIKVTTFDYDDAHIIVEGQLKDNRNIPYYSHSGKLRSPGSVHNLLLRLLIHKESIRIVQVEIEMPGVPHEECKEVIPNFSRLTGLRIAKGFTSKVRELLGGPNGCAHLNGLLMAMATAALQGLWTYRARNLQDGNDIKKRVNEYLVDTCWFWRQDSPHIHQLLKGYGVE